ncbi:hypothetical protein ALQ93_102433 [Pseudomonas syringae pv. pisi]|uniref:Uncharacterized protein n=3 Tax=Pseudomonas syringae group TaxID=136849 RepID=A0A3M6DS37_PSESJ|nr:hypothetical protein ALQ93_102433 [Pseudomonas syringae pv. pisi]RMU59324.1 hypothetical protein ALP25_102158 [Pseudomonas syringae pv. syringae]RMU92247.1 hypothetical protein ALP21_102115 [Pseudomonas savastanoi pv. phaseolicola]RML59552.1 hypothetical protein ALQ92_102047 [Pseudomonas syringae pv. pisi]RMM17673.1 hypothetical protein ALQ81_102183 [Pseudomonas syringae pv. pisi]
MGVGTASGIRVAPLAQENNPDQQCTGHAQNRALRLAMARGPAAGDFTPLRWMVWVRSSQVLPAQTPDTLSIRCCTDNNESMR